MFGDLGQPILQRAPMIALAAFPAQTFLNGDTDGLGQAFARNARQFPREPMSPVVLDIERQSTPGTP